MMLVALSTLGQYPTTKKIGNDQVVIMTINQAEKIDNQFLKQKDSIFKLNSIIEFKNNDLQTVILEKNRLNDTIKGFKNSLIFANTVIDSLKKETVRIEKLEFIEKRTRNRLSYGLGAVLVTWLVFAFSVIKN